MKTRGNRNKKIHTKKKNSISFDGGAIEIGKGSYGKYYGDPRLRCNDETKYDYENVSKLFKDEFSAISAYEIKERIEKSSLNDVKNLSDYFVLPIKMCDSKTDDLIENDIEIHQKNLMIISERASNDLFAEIQRIRFQTPFVEDLLLDFHDIMKKLENIFSAVQLLQHHNFIHGDIKPQNVLVQNNVYKLGDLDSMASINSEDELQFPRSTDSFYYIWPSLCVYCCFFNLEILKKYQIPFSGKVSEVEITDKILGKLTLLNIIYAPIQNFFERIDKLKDTNKEYYNELIDRSRAQHNNFSYFRQQFPKFLANKEDIPEIKRIYKVIQNEKRFNHTSPEELSNYLKRWNSHFQSKKSMMEVKLDLYKRIDIYSLGMIILPVINMFTSKIEHAAARKKVTDPTIAQELNSIVFSFYKIIEKCCVQVEFPPSIDEICQDYHRSVQLFDDLISKFIKTPKASKRKSTSASKPTSKKSRRNKTL